MKKLAAILLVLAMIMGFAACGGKTEPENTTVAPEETTAPVEEIPSEPESVPSSEATSDVSAPDASAVDASELVSDPLQSTAAAVVAPTNNAEIVALYNNAVNSAFDAKAGFGKTRYVDNVNMDMSLALKAFKSLVEKFVGIGDENKYNETVSKGNWDSDAKKNYLRKSTITEADLTGASCKQDGNFFVVTLNIKGGSSKGSEDSKFTNAPVDKCGICVGKEDKGYYDHKTGEVIYDAIEGTYSAAKIDESYSNAKAVAKIDANGKLVSLTVTYDMAVAIDIGIGSGTASGTSHIVYKDFKY